MVDAIAITLPNTGLRVGEHVNLACADAILLPSVREASISHGKCGMSRMVPLNATLLDAPSAAAQPVAHSCLPAA